MNEKTITYLQPSCFSMPMLVDDEVPYTIALSSIEYLRVQGMGRSNCLQQPISPITTFEKWSQTELYSLIKLQVNSFITKFWTFYVAYTYSVLKNAFSWSSGMSYGPSVKQQMFDVKSCRHLQLCSITNTN